MAHQRMMDLETDDTCECGKTKITITNMEKEIGSIELHPSMEQ